MKRQVIAVLLACLFVGLGPADLGSQESLRPTVILISFDGWRWDYQSRYRAPNLQRLIVRGVLAEWMTPSFPSKTFPNHYSIVTGLYPGHHGIVANSIKDQASNSWFSMSDRPSVQNAMWWGGEPVWVTVQRAGRPAGAMFWPGSEAPIQGMWPRYWTPFDDRMSGNERVDRVLGLLDLPDATRPALTTLYFSDVDTAGHRYGPDASQTREAVFRTDRYLGRLINGLERRRLLDRVHIVVVSDHGMAATSDAERVIVLDDHVALDDVEIVDLNPTIGLNPRPGRAEAVYQALAKVPRLNIYRRAESPAQWRMREHPRVPAIIGVADEGWQILRRSTLNQRRSGRAGASRGEHGYDPASATSMRAIFVAAGPRFKRGLKAPPFENVNVYNMLTDILEVVPAPNDGDPAVARSLLVD